MPASSERGSISWGAAWSLSAFCERRDALRTFRLDRLTDSEVLEATFEGMAGSTLEDLVRSSDDEGTAMVLRAPGAAQLEPETKGRQPRCPRRN